ncbi:prealbumin-like fold domain-containing protein [Flavobacterium faecale]|uniref:prealbumin-like fold domain-containing protein n=1 Tax=Flavobacterium faecale TaxID=1355330 RepID=UPI003CCBF2E9
MLHRNLHDRNCTAAFDSTNTFGTGWTFTLKNSSGGTAKTAVTDNNGNIFFSGIADGTYTIVTTPLDPYLPSNPTGGIITFAISGNTVKNLTFYNCTK